VSIVHLWMIHDGRNIRDTNVVSIASETGDTTIAGRWWHPTPPKLLLLTNQTKLTLIVTLTLTDTVMVIFFTRISLTPTKRLYRNNEKNFCGGRVRGWANFFPFADFLPVCWQECNSKFILYRWKRVFLWGSIRKRGWVFWGHNRKKKSNFHVP